MVRRPLTPGGVICALVLLGALVRPTDVLAQKKKNAAARAGAPPPLRIATYYRRINIVVNDSGAQIPASTTEGFQYFFLRERAGKGTHMLSIARIPMGVSEDELRHAATTGKLDALDLTFLGGPGMPDTSGVRLAQLDLRRGRYFLMVESVDERGRRHVVPGGMGVLRAIGITKFAAPLPPPTHAVVQLEDDGIDISQGLTPGRDNMLQVKNVGLRDHELVVRHLAPGATRADVVRWLETRKGPRPFMPMGGTTRISRGKTIYIVVPLPKGEYLFSCDLPGHGHGASKLVQLK
jgi:hypothetical protein